jgi:hypothetical protein
MRRMAPCVLETYQGPFTNLFHLESWRFRSILLWSKLATEARVSAKFRPQTS